MDQSISCERLLMNLKINVILSMVLSIHTIIKKKWPLE